LSATQVSDVKVGLEIHRQLDTQSKLFCACPTDFAESDTEPEEKFLRRLRPTQSELGQIDQAALFEFHRGRGVLYESDHQTSCLVEMDEEPPAKLNTEAVETCLTASLLMNAKPVDEVHVMRKVVIDGSNTTGFQRTSVVALDGMLRVGEKDVPIQQISLEEDAARKTGQNREIVGFRIDRLGVPLIEVTTGPVIESPAEAERVALAIGTTLRATRKVKRGLGSIRQDLNISIPGGALIEIKGVQELDLIGKAVEFEVNRQKSLIQIREELARRQVREDSIEKKYEDLSHAFTETKARILKEALSKNGIILGLKLPKFGGLLGKELGPGLRLGTEMSSRASFWGGVGGIFHTDELPGYGITEEEIKHAKELMHMDSSDALVLVADESSRAKDALDAVVDRAREALVGVPDETRMAMPDGSTRYMRPRPGAARMYPETDVPPTPVTQEWIAELKANLPETPEETVSRLKDQFSINEKLAKQLIDSDYLNLFERIASSSEVPASFVATTLSETCKNLERAGFPVHAIPDEMLAAIFKLVDDEIMTKEAVQELLEWQSKNPHSDPRLGAKEIGLRMISEAELDKIIDRHIEKNRKLVEEKGSAAFSSLMGSVMSEVRGSIEPKLVSEKLKEKLATTTRK
jgi:glutamyl-tRNA(Gln) amidotransferase subunit E